MKIKIEGLDCPNCAKKLEAAINKLPSIKSAEINFLKSQIIFSSDNEQKAIQDITSITKTYEPKAKIIIPGQMAKNGGSLWLDVFTLALGIIFGALCFIFQLPNFVFWACLLASALLLGYKTYIKAIKLIFRGQVNENLLVTLSVFGAILIGEKFEGLMVICLYSIGKILEGIAVNKSKKSIENLTNFKPEYANLIKNDSQVKVAPSEIKVGDIIVVNPGERVPIDGIIVEGTASVDLQSLTGESLPQTATENSEILSGAIVLDSVLKIKATKEYNQSTVNTILELIENASEKKSKTETFISRIMKWYTLGVVALAISVCGVVWLITKNFNTAVYRGLIFLVVSCPCAFAISVPLSYFSGLGNASKNGILIKGANYLDACAKLNLIAFDKTGTLTTGEFEITSCQSQDKRYSSDDILYFAALGEQHSLHPLAKSILKQNSRPLKHIKNVKEVAGSGVYFSFETHEYFVGRKQNNHEKTVIEVFEDDKKIGQITLQDQIKQTSKSALKMLSQMKINSAILSGDNEKIVADVAKKISANNFYSQLLPQEKYAKIEQFKTKNKVGYVGDGLNDAPSLTLSDVGFCMGLKGNSASIEASDIVIANDNLEKIPQAIKISKFTRKIVWQNIIFSFAVKATFLTLGAVGITGMLFAVIADVGVTLIAILNSLRALTHKTKP